MSDNRHISRKLEELERHVQDIKMTLLSSKQNGYKAGNDDYEKFQVKNCPKETLRKSRLVYTGKKYQSTLQYTDLDNRAKCKNFFITSSTLANINQKHYVNMTIQSIQVPGTTLSQLKSVCTTELLHFQNVDDMNIMICCGLNDFLKGENTIVIMNNAKQVKEHIKKLVPNSTINFVPVPLAPKLCWLPGNPEPLQNNKVKELLKFNDFVQFSLSDTSHHVSLQDEGIVPSSEGGSKIWEFQGHDGSTRRQVTGKRHDSTLWRETNFNEALHLSDPVRTSFWEKKIVTYFSQLS